MDREYLANYHTHTYRCMHATGTDEAYVLRAIDLGYDLLGFSDHTPWPYESDFVANMRMPLGELDGYLDSLRRLRDAYAGRIDIKIGLECEAFPAYFDWLARLKAEKELDYLILGNHYDTTDENCARETYFGGRRWAGSLTKYAKLTVQGMETGLFACLAHPDLALCRAREYDSEGEEMCIALCEAAQRLDMPLEYNLLGARRRKQLCAEGFVGYTTPMFWEVAARYDVRAIIGADAHNPDELDCLRERREVRKKLSAAGIPVTDIIR